MQLAALWQQQQHQRQLQQQQHQLQYAASFIAKPSGLHSSKSASKNRADRAQLQQEQERQLHQQRLLQQQL